MDKLRIVLVALYRYQNFPIRIMHALLESIENIEVYSIFFKNRVTNMCNSPTAREKELFGDIVARLNPRIVGFSVLSPFAAIAQQLTEIVKNNAPSSLVIWGGIHPTISPESCINKVDMLCIGEGEETIVELAQHLRDGKNYHSIKNLWIKDNGQIIKNSMRPLVQDLDSLPLPSYGNKSYYFIDNDQITQNDPVLLYNFLSVHASRGCPFSCSYCVNSLLHPLFKELGPYIRMRSVSNIIKEIKQFRKVDEIYFLDEVFTTDRTWIEEFSARYKKEIGIPFIVWLNPLMISPIVISKLASSGLSTIRFGIQTGSDRIRNRIFNRPGSNEQIKDIAKKITEHKVTITYDLIMDNPYETEKSLEEAIELLLQLPKPLSFSLFSLQYFPKYPLTKKAIEDKYIQINEMDVDRLFERTSKNFGFVPKLLPYTRKQILQNIIWLISQNRVKNSIIKYAVFGGSLASRIVLNYVNFKSIIIGKMLGAGGILLRNNWIVSSIKAVKYLLRRDFKTFYLKAIRRL